MGLGVCVLMDGAVEVHAVARQLRLLLEKRARELLQRLGGIHHAGARAARGNPPRRVHAVRTEHSNAQLATERDIESIRVHDRRGRRGLYHCHVLGAEDAGLHHADLSEDLGARRVRPLRPYHGADVADGRRRRLVLLRVDDQHLQGLLALELISPRNHLLPTCGTLFDALFWLGRAEATTRSLSMLRGVRRRHCMRPCECARLRLIVEIKDSESRPASSFT